MRNPHLAAIFSVCSLLFTGCSFSGSGAFVPNAVAPAPDSVSPSVAKVTVKITVATKKAGRSSARGLHPHYFSASSSGLSIQAFAHGSTTRIAQVAVNISPGAPACGGKRTTPRTCTATLRVPASTGDDFIIGDYNLKPARGKIPAKAHLLGYGTLTNKPVSSGKTNKFNVYLGGVISGLSGNRGFVSLPGDGETHSLAIVIHATDFGNHPIRAGKRDPFANPVTVTVAETGGTGHMLLSLNGATAATSVTVKYSNDGVELKYDGKGSAGYGAIVTLTAPSFNGGGATEQIALSPLLIASTSSDFKSGVLNLNGNGDVATLDASELNAPKATSYKVSAKGVCYAIADAEPVVQTSASLATFTVIAGAAISTPPPGSGCTLAVSDGSTTVDVGVNNSYSGKLGKTAPKITDYAVPSAASLPAGIAAGPDGEMWFTENAGAQVGKIQPTATKPVIAEFVLPHPYGTPGPFGIAAGTDGNMWWADGSSSTVGSITTSGGGMQLPTQAATSYPLLIARAADGAMWFTECGTTGGNAIGRVTSGGTRTYYTIPTADSSPYGIAAGSDGNVWFAEYLGNKIGKITLAGHITEFSVSSAGQPAGMTAGPDGAIWFTEYSGNRIGRIPVNATSYTQIAEYKIPTAGAHAEGITTGPDGALWFNEFGTNKIGRLDPALASPGTTLGITEYNVPSATSQNGYGIASGPDGAIWFTEGNSAAGKIGRVTLSTSGKATPTKRAPR